MVSNCFFSIALYCVCIDINTFFSKFHDTYKYFMYKNIIFIIKLYITFYIYKMLECKTQFNK